IGTETPPGNCTVSHGFFFQAEDGIRDFHVTGVQTCALPIFSPAFGMIGTVIGLIKMLANLSDPDQIGSGLAVALITTFYGALLRSEERRVGKECRSLWWGSDHTKQKCKGTKSRNIFKLRHLL